MSRWTNGTGYVIADAIRVRHRIFDVRVPHGQWAGTRTSIMVEE